MTHANHFGRTGYNALCSDQYLSVRDHPCPLKRSPWVRGVRRWGRERGGGTSLNGLGRSWYRRNRWPVWPQRCREPGPSTAYPSHLGNRNTLPVSVRYVPPHATGSRQHAGCVERATRHSFDSHRRSTESCRVRSVNLRDHGQVVAGSLLAHSSHLEDCQHYQRHSSTLRCRRFETSNAVVNHGQSGICDHQRARQQHLSAHSVGQ